MRISLKQLKKMSVETQSGVDLGGVKDILFDVDAHTILQYEVGGLIGENILISPAQVIRFETDRMIVKDSVQKLPSSGKAQQVTSRTGSMLMREEG